MTLVVVIQLAVVLTLTWIAMSKGLERALPFYTFATALVPGACSIAISGLFVLTTQRVALLTLLLLFCVLGKGNRFSQQRSLPLKWLIVANAMWCIVSTVHSVVPSYSVKKVMGEVAEYYLLYYILSRTITDIRTVGRIVYALVLSVGLACLVGVCEAYSEWRLMSLFPVDVDTRFSWIVDESGRGSRITSTFAHPILFGAAIVMAIPLAMYLISTARSRINRALLWSAVLLMFLNLYKTASRGPWLGAIVSFVLLLPICGKKVRKYMLATCMLCLATLIIRPGVWDTLKETYYETGDTSAPMGRSYEYRYALWNVVKAALSKDFGRAVWGYGPESFFYLKLQGDFLDKPDHLFLSCDSAWMEFAIETGYVGLTLLAMLLLQAAHLSVKDALRLPEPHNRLSWLLVVTMVAYYFMMISVAMYAWGQNGEMLWIIIGSSLAYGRLSRHTAERRTISTIESFAMENTGEPLPAGAGLLYARCGAEGISQPQSGMSVTKGRQVRGHVVG